MPFSESISLAQVLNTDSGQFQQLLCALGDLKRDRVEEREAEAPDSEALLAVFDMLQNSEIDHQQAILDLLDFCEPALSTRLTSAQRGLLILADRIYNEAQYGLPIDSAFLDVLQMLRIPFIRAAFTQADLLLHPEHSLCRLLDEIFSAAVTWHESLGKAGSQFHDGLADVLSTFIVKLAAEQEALEQHCEAVLSFLQQDRARAEKLEQRLAEAEVGAIKAKLAHTELITFLNDKVAGQILPESLIDYLQGTWRFEMQVHLIQEGMQSPVWLRWKKIIETVVWIFATSDDEHQRKKLYRIVPAMGQEFESNIAAISKNPDAHAPMLIRLDEAFVDVLKGSPRNLDTAPPIAMPEMLDGIETRISKALLKKVDEIGEGSWFLHKDEQDKLLRCKLLIKIPDTDQLLFVNRVGQKAMQKGVEDFAFCLSTKITRMLDVEQLFSTLIRKTLEQEVEQHERQRVLQEIEAARQDEAARLAEEQRRAAEEERAKEQQRLEQARIAAAEKAEAEARALEAAKAREREERAALAAEEEARLRQQRKEEDEARRADAIKVARLTVDTLNVGAWVSIPNKDGVQTKCKLAVKLNSTGKHVFVDRVGVKVGENYRDELIELFVKGEAELLEQGAQFEERLAKVVGSLRKDKSSGSPSADD